MGLHHALPGQRERRDEFTAGVEGERHLCGLRAEKRARKPGGLTAALRVTSIRHSSLCCRRFNGRPGFQYADGSRLLAPTNISCDSSSAQHSWVGSRVAETCPLSTGTYRHRTGLRGYALSPTPLSIMCNSTEQGGKSTQGFHLGNRAEAAQMGPLMARLTTFQSAVILCIAPTPALHSTPPSLTPPRPFKASLGGGRAPCRSGLAKAASG
ncbi:hypothetical protein P4O66_003164 [Electrophorus voltai]|uniref:Uncharacterized protein n=1 Tax=Electrophorus voltai TaxID=2609070 RepID=A0AAD8YR49_9TELE|nr:hypothetical protein P4O66_003164 [Electrophorus voltai]